MTTIKAKLQEHSPSTNIERDNLKSLNYIPTPNSEESYLKIANDYRIGLRSFNIVGAYGTGKSSFLLAFEQTLSGKEKFFKKIRNQFNGINQFEFIRIVGTHDSIVEIFAKKLQVPVSKNLTSAHVLEALNNYSKKLKKTGKGLVIFIDEFGKFLEFAAKYNPEKELYFIQELAEFANDILKEILLITTLHQDFNGYSRTLTKSQQNEWDKVKGRLKEIPFNEPVEQLLYLGAERISQLGIHTSSENFNELFASIEKSKLFPLSDYNTKEFAKKLLPFDLLSAAVITSSLQKYGQNERSLFAFIESNDVLGIKEFSISKAPYYNLALVYDYLAFNFYSFLQANDNTDKSHWYSIRNAIERCEGLLNEKALDAIKLVKTIGLLNLFGSTSGKLNIQFLEQYGRYSLGIKNTKTILASLETNKIIRYATFNQKYVLFEGTDVDIDLAINEAGNLVETVSNVVTHLTKYFEGGFIPAKAVFYEKGTPRFFQFILSETPETRKVPEGEVDGFINLIFSEFIKERDIEQQSASCKEATLFGLFINTAEISKEIYNIEKINKAIETHRDDIVAVRVLNEVKQGHLKLLNHYVNGSLYNNITNIIWYFRGQRIREIRDRKTFNQCLSWICNQVYEKTPVYKNELLNKTNYSAVVSNARKGLMKKLIEDAHLENIGFLPSEFPPSKSIYLTLLKDTGIHHLEGTAYIIGEPQNESLHNLWNISINFLESTQFGKRSLKDFSDMLLAKPYKCKQGLVDFWIPIFLIIKRDNFALFHNGIFIPSLTEDTLDLVVRNIEDYEIKAFQVEGIRLDLFNKYRTLINKNESSELKIDSFIDTIKPFLAFYKKLTFYAQGTNTISDNAKRLRAAILTSQDPEVTFFEKFPEAFGYTISSLRKNPTDLQSYIVQMQDAIRELRTVYFELSDRFEEVIQKEIIGKNVPFEEYKNALMKRYTGIKGHLLNQTHRKIIAQFLSPIDDRNSWLNAVAQACVDKRLESFTDTDEKILYDKFISYINQLDNLCELSQQNIDLNNEDIIKLEITSFVETMQERIIRMPKSKTIEANKLAENLQNKLSGDKQLNIVTLIKLLKEQLENE